MAIEQKVDFIRKPILFFSAKLTQTKCSTFPRKLLAIYLVIKQFRYILEGKNFIILTDHKLINHAINNSAGK